MQEIIEFPCLRQLTEVIMQGPVVLHDVSSILMIKAVKALVSLGRISTHSIGPLKNGSFFIFSSIWYTGSLNSELTNWTLTNVAWLWKSLWGRSLWYLPPRGSLFSWNILALPFPRVWSSSNLLYLSMWSISWRMFKTNLIVNDFLNSCSVRRPTLKVLTTTSSKSPSTSLYVSQYRLVNLEGLPFPHGHKQQRIH